MCFAALVGTDVHANAMGFRLVQAAVSVYATKVAVLNDIPPTRATVSNRLDSVFLFHGVFPSI